MPKTEDHSHQQQGRHHHGQEDRINRTTQAVSALACAAVMALVLAVMALVGSASRGQTRSDIDGGDVRTAPIAPAYTSSPGWCPLERIGDQLVRCDNLTGAGAVAPPWVPEQISTRAYLSSPRRCPLERIGNQLVRCDNLTGAAAVAPPWVPERASALVERGEPDRQHR